MRERINRLAKGIVDGEALKLTAAPERIEDTVQAGGLTRKELFVADAQGRFIKGLVYSSSMRVLIQENAFGGGNNRIVYQVDSRNLTREDVIEGFFSLVTNGGEQKIPYSFSIDTGAIEKVIGSLKTPEDFAALVRRDYDLALKLFEYRELAEAPFLQDLHVSALYHGLKGRLNRKNQLEEFLVALHVKEPVELRTEEKPRKYDRPETAFKDDITVTASGWGYVQFEVLADGEFLSFEKESYTSQDFENGVCRIHYQINPANLHQGKNLGAVHIRSIRKTITVAVEVTAEETPREHAQRWCQDALMEYLTLRLKYEFGLHEEQLLINQMKQPLERLRKLQGDTLENLLLQGETALLEGQKDRAQVILENARGELEKRKEQGVSRELACFYQYLRAIAYEDEGAMSSLLYRVTQYLEQDPASAGLYLLKLKMEPQQEEGLSARLEELRQMYQAGSHSPYLYAEAFRIYEKNPLLLGRMGDYEVQVMSFGARYGLVNEELAVRIAEPASSSKHYRRLYCRLLMRLYDTYQNKEILAAVCSMLIKGECRTPEYFVWYQKALEAGISLTRLYEYYLYSLPYDYPYLLPKEVLLYFSYEKSMDDFSRSILYMNILKYMNPGNPLYKQYERDMEQFTMEQLLHSRINRRYVVLYEHMLYKEMIDGKVARVLPSILRSYRVQVKNPNIRYVIVCYEETEGEYAFPVKDGAVYVPLFSEHPVLLFEDDFGNRYAGISYRKLPAMNGKHMAELEEQCFSIYPGHPMLRLQECGELAEAGISCDEDLFTLKRAVTEMDLRPLFKRKIVSQIIAYYRKRLEAGTEEAAEDVDYFMDLDLASMSRRERAGICETLILQDYIREAWELIKTYGCEGVKNSRLLKLCSRLILYPMQEEDETLLKVAWQIFSSGQADSVVLDYLCEHFNGSTKQMFELLCQGIKEHVEVYDLPERLLAQMMFTGETAKMDQVFDWYVSGKKTSDQVIKAYFTMKSSDYFLRNKATGPQVFAYLESAVLGASAKYRIPTIYLLALTKYYSTLKELDEERRNLCTAMVELLLEEGRSFSWFYDLGRLIPMPESVMDKATVEYHGGIGGEPELEVRILPEDEAWKPEELKKVYPGIYVHQKVLFSGETLEYRVWERKQEERILSEEGSLSSRPVMAGEECSRFAMLNRMSQAAADGDEAALKHNMRKYVTDSAMMEELFGLL